MEQKKYDINDIVSRKAAQYGLNPVILRGQIMQESSDNPRAVSSAGAMGLAQLMPATAKSLGVNPFDPEQAIDGQARLMQENLRATKGDYNQALMMYHGSPNRDKWGEKTKAYPSLVMSKANALDPNIFNQAQGTTMPQPKNNDDALIEQLLGGQTTEARPSAYKSDDALIEQLLGQPSQGKPLVAPDVVPTPSNARMQEPVANNQQELMQGINKQAREVQNDAYNALVGGAVKGVKGLANQVANVGYNAAVVPAARVADDVKYNMLGYEKDPNKPLADYEKPFFSGDRWGHDYVNDVVGSKVDDFAKSYLDRIQDKEGSGAKAVEYAATEAPQWLLPSAALGAGIKGTGAALKLTGEAATATPKIAKILQYVGGGAEKAGGAIAKSALTSPVQTTTEVAGSLYAGKQAELDGADWKSKLLAEVGGGLGTSLLYNAGKNYVARPAANYLRNMVGKETVEAGLPQDVIRKITGGGDEATGGQAAPTAIDAANSAQNLGVNLKNKSAYLLNPESKAMKEAANKYPDVEQSFLNETAQNEILDIREAAARGLQKRAEKSGIDFNKPSIDAEQIGGRVKSVVELADKEYSKQVNAAYKAAEKNGAALTIDNPKEFIKGVRQYVQEQGVSATEKELKKVDRLWKEYYSPLIKDGQNVTLNSLEKLRKQINGLSFDGVSHAESARIKSKFLQGIDAQIEKSGLLDVYPEARAAHQMRKGMQEAFSYFVNPKTGETTSKDVYKFYDRILKGNNPEEAARVINVLKDLSKKAPTEDAQQSAAQVLDDIRHYILKDTHGKLADNKTSADALKKIVTDKTRALNPTLETVFTDADGKLIAAGEALQDVGRVARQYFRVANNPGSSKVNAGIADRLKNAAGGAAQVAADPTLIGKVGGIARILSSGAGILRRTQADEAKYFFKTGKELPKDKSIAATLKRQAVNPVAQAVGRANINQPTQE